MADAASSPVRARLSRTEPDGQEPFRLGWAPRRSLARHVAYIWANRSTLADPLLPDGAVELVWSGRGLFVRGADTRPHQVGVFPEQTFVAVRFRPGGAADVLGLHGRVLADARVGISLLWGRAEMERLESLLAACTSSRQAADVLEDMVAARARRPPDPAVAAVVAALAARREPVPVAALADRIGFSERQLRRRCVAALGYGPKTLHRILRFQRFRRLGAGGHHIGLAEARRRGRIRRPGAPDARVPAARRRNAGCARRSASRGPFRSRRPRREALIVATCSSPARITSR